MQTVDEEHVVITKLRYALRVKRWHTMPNIQGQTVGEHSAQAVSLLLLLHTAPSVNLISAMLWHDAGERGVGDMPAPIRRANPELNHAYCSAEEDFIEREYPRVGRVLAALTEEEYHWLKAIDVLELVLYCADEFHLGNQHAQTVARRGLEYLTESSTTPIEVLAFVKNTQFCSYPEYV